MKPIDLSTLTDEQLAQELAKRKELADNALHITDNIAANPLKCKTVTRVEVDSSDLEQFIFKVFGVRYESACTEEMSNDSERSYTVDGFNPDDKCACDYTIPEVERFLFKNGKKEPALSYLLNYFADKGYIAKGDYTVCWSW
jgi:hypothetical protein